MIKVDYNQCTGPLRGKVPMYAAIISRKLLDSLVPATSCRCYNMSRRDKPVINDTAIKYPPKHEIKPVYLSLWKKTSYPVESTMSEALITF